MRSNNLNGLLLVSICTIIFSATTFAQTSTFNFQGRLNNGASPASGSFDFEFKLFDAVAGGVQIGGTTSRPGLVVNDGIFSTQLDFGAAAFGGAARYVEIGVRPSGTTDPFTILNPRQQVLSAPYSIKAKNADQLGGIDASQYVTTTTVGNSFIKNDTVQQSANLNISGNAFFGGNVGVGTAAPDTKLQVQSSGYGITQTSGGVTVGSFISTASGGSGWFGTRSNHPLNFFTNNSQPQLTLTTGGNLGIGTAAPTAKIEVASVLAGQTGIYAESPSGRAIWGKSNGSRGVYGESLSLEGVYGVSSTGAGVSGNSGVGIGVYGESTGATAIGVYARNVNGGRAIYADGNVTQTLQTNGLVKAMLYVQQDGVILSCFNGITNVSTGNCGFSITRLGAGNYFVSFGFRVDNRFLSATARNPIDPSTRVAASFRFVENQPEQIRVLTFITNVTTTGDDAYFMLIVY